MNKIDTDFYRLYFVSYTTHIYSNIFLGYFKVSHGHKIKFYMNEITFLMKLYYLFPNIVQTRVLLGPMTKYQTKGWSIAFHVEGSPLLPYLHTGQHAWLCILILRVRILGRAEIFITLVYVIIIRPDDFHVNDGIV